MDQTLVLYRRSLSPRDSSQVCSYFVGLSLPPTKRFPPPLRDPSYTPLGLRISAKVYNNQCSVILNIWGGEGGGVSRRQEIHSILNVLVFQCHKYTVRTHEE